jgi:hypothetical protein
MNVFENHASAPKGELRVSKTGNGQCSTWFAAEVGDLHQGTENPTYNAQLPKIALRLETAMCSEAENERTLGQRKFPWSHPMRAKSDLLLARTRLEKVAVGHVVVRKSDCIVIEHEGKAALSARLS